MELTKAERKLIQELLVKKKKKVEIARILGRSHTTIGREVNNEKNWEYVRVPWFRGRKHVVKMYSWERAQKNHEQNKLRCGAKYKFAQDWSGMEFVESWVKRGDSPAVAIERAELQGVDIAFCERTFYNYVEHGLSKVTPFDLRFKLRRKQPKHKKIRENKRKMGKSIELRPESINSRQEFGHWEGDCIVDKNDNAILVVQERKSRYCILTKLEKHESAEVLRHLARLKREHNMKSITVDNGSEFWKITQLEDENFEVYFTHPYSSFEKGGVENLNGMVRRYIPKGSDLSMLTQEMVTRVQQQVNAYPRGIHGYYTAEEVYISLTKNAPIVIIPRPNNVVFLDKKMCN